LYGGTFPGADNLCVKDVRESVDRSIASDYLAAVLVDCVAIAYIFNPSVVPFGPIGENSDVL
jgi:hypothetical protein